MGLVEVFEQGDEGVLTGLHRGGAESERHHECPVAGYEIDFARDRDVSVLGARVGMVEPFVGHAVPATRRRRRRIQRIGRATAPKTRAPGRGAPVPRTASVNPCSRRPTPYSRRRRWRDAARAARRGGNPPACPEAGRSARAAAPHRATDRSGSPSRSDSGRQRRCCEPDTLECRRDL